ncbi:MAG: DUF1326 domain-containing protein [Candidatus Methylomirabilia bacterium]
MASVEWRMKGQYLKNCNCIATCPCDTVGVPYPHKGCEGMAGMHIVEGNFGNVRLDGLTWIATYHWPGALHEGNGSLQPFIDQKATEEQRNALLQILSGQAGNPWFQILASIVTTVHEPQFVPISFEFDKAKRRTRVVIPGALETASAPLTVPATGGEQRVVVRMPDGMEYREMEVAQAVVLTGSGAIKFNHKNSHSSLAEVEHTQAGLT